MNIQVLKCVHLEVVLKLQLKVLLVQDRFLFLEVYVWIQLIGLNVNVFILRWLFLDLLILWFVFFQNSFLNLKFQVWMIQNGLVESSWRDHLSYRFTFGLFEKCHEVYISNIKIAAILLQFLIGVAQTFVPVDLGLVSQVFLICYKI